MLAIVGLVVAASIGENNSNGSNNSVTTDQSAQVGTEDQEEAPEKMHQVI